MNGLYWLVEYEGAQPVPVYAPTDEDSDGFYTCHPWKARRFETKEEAEAWMNDAKIHVTYGFPWRAAEHGFGAYRGVNS